MNDKVIQNPANVPFFLRSKDVQPVMGCFGALTSAISVLGSLDLMPMYYVNFMYK